MIGVSRQTDYAARIVLHLAALGPGASATIRDVAQQKRLPTPFIRRIVSQLVEHGIVETIRGNRGGIKLQRAPKDISLLDLVEALEGPLEMSECIGEHASCPFLSRCPVQIAWRRVTDDLRQSLDSIRFDALSATRGHKRAHRALAVLGNGRSTAAPRKG